MSITADAQSDAPASEIDVFLKRVEQGTQKLLAREPELAAKMPDPAVTEANARPGVRACEMIANVFRAYGDRPALGERIYEVASDAATGRNTIRYLPEFRTITYSQVWDRAQALSNVWRGGGGSSMAPGSKICVLAFASIDYAVIDLACTYTGMVLVPLQTNVLPEDLATIIAEIRPEYFATSIEHLVRATGALIADGKNHRLAVIDYEPRDDNHRDRYAAAEKMIAEAGAAIRLVPLASLIERGRTLQPQPPHMADEGENQVGTIFYTSGSTGTPKGVMVPDSFFRIWWGTPSHPFPNVTLCYQPLNHALGRLVVINALKSGGTCYFLARSDMSTLFEDVRLVRPTIFDFVPRVAEQVYHHFHSEVRRRLHSGGDEAAIRAAVMLEMRENYLGGRVITGMIGTAPSQPEACDFIRECFDILLPDTYGATETALVSFNNRIARPPVIDYKLRDVPELGYFTTDKPFPRGELLVKTKAAVLGYYNNPEMTAALFDEDGYIITGDIFEEHAPDVIVYIDRRKNVFKLAQGEFVAIARLESIFASDDPLIHQIYVYGSGRRAYLLAVVVPDMAEVRARIGRDPSDAELAVVLREVLQEIGRKEQLRAYEMPRELIVEREPFSNGNGLLSSVGKHLRPALKEKYGDRLERLYEDIERRQLDEFEELRQAGPSTDVPGTLAKAIQVTLGLSGVLSERQTFAELGGDSLAAVSLSVLLEETFGVAIPVGTILNPANSLTDLARQVELRMAGNVEGVDFASVHGEADCAVAAKDLVLDRFIDSAALSAVPAIAAPRWPIRNVLLTGANGFLGRFLLLEWAARVAPHGGKVICLLRASCAEAARVRLDKALALGDGAAAARLAELGEGCIEMLAGDLSAPRLGLDESTFSRLAEEVDLIVHPAALVNHVLPYRQLFGPNVVGTAELIRLALTRVIKPIDYVSSLAVSFADHGVVVGEDEDIRLASPERLIDGSYANGYSISKWAGEVLLREAHERFGLPVNVYRSDMILAHDDYAGQINSADMFSRLLYSIVKTGIAPASFHVPTLGGDRSKPPYDGLPVNFTAEAMAGIGVAGHQGFRTFNLSNPHADGISLDEIVDWVADEGHDVTRVANYDEWFERFESALNGLSEAERQQSSVMLLDQLRHQASADSVPEIKTGRFEAIVKALSLGDDGEVPRLSRSFIRKCLSDLHMSPAIA